MAAEDLDDFWDFLNEDGFYTPPLKSREHPDGKKYHVPSPDALTGARLSALLAIGAKREAARQGAAGAEITESDVAKLRLEGDDERDFMQQCLGDAYTAMMADGVKWQAISSLGQFAFIYWTQGASVAQDAARRGVFQGGGKAGAPTAPASTSKASPKTTGSTRSSRAPTTRSRPKTS